MSAISMSEHQPSAADAHGGAGAGGAAPCRERDDAQLLARWSAHGDRAALAELMARHADAAYAVALRVTGHASDAEDAVQEGVMAVMLHASDYRPRRGASVPSWMLIGPRALTEPQLAIGARIHAYLTQPFYVTVGFMGMPGRTVTQEQLWSDLDRLLHGACADVPAASLRYRGALPNP